MAEQQDLVGRYAARMIILAWIAGVILLTVIFQQILAAPERPQVIGGVGGVAEPGASVLLQRNGSGQYLIRGRINGHAVRMLLDTGATEVAIPEALAMRMGLPHEGSGFSQTANGVVAVWSTTLREVAVGSIRLRDVRATIVPGMDGSELVLLGMSFLRRLEMVQRDGEMLLRVPQVRQR